MTVHIRRSRTAADRRSVLLPILLVLLNVLLNACTTTHMGGASVDPKAWTAYQDQARRVLAWDLQGKISIRHRDRQWNLNFDWKQDGRRYMIHLHSLLGHSIHLAGLASKVYIRRGRQPPMVAETPEQALDDLLGIDAPVTFLRHWILGIPTPHASVTAREMNERGLVRSIEQSGWRVRYVRRHDEMEHRLPQQMVIENDDTRLVIWISVWDKVRYAGSAA